MIKPNQAPEELPCYCHKLGALQCGLASPHLSDVFRVIQVTGPQNQNQASRAVPLLPSQFNTDSPHPQQELQTTSLSACRGTRLNVDVFSVRRDWSCSPGAGVGRGPYLRVLSPAKVVPAEVFPHRVAVGAGAGAGGCGQAPHLVELYAFIQFHEVQIHPELLAPGNNGKNRQLSPFVFH